MLKKWQTRLTVAIVAEMRLRMQEELANQYLVGVFLSVLSMDLVLKFREQNRINRRIQPGKNRNVKELKRRKAKKQSAESIEKKTATTQIWLTLLWHVSTGLPWAWKSGPSDSSERPHLQEMLSELPDHSLITADAGFVGYDFWKSIIDAKHDFLIRIGANVKLIKQLGYARGNGSTVYLWPDRTARKNEPPLVLRLIVIHNGRHPVYLVTSITYKKKLSDKQARVIYQYRWGIEVIFRTFKQTVGRHKLRSHNAENAKMELDWSLLALWMISLLVQRELVQSGEDPSQLSPARPIHLQRLKNEPQLSG